MNLLIITTLVCISCDVVPFLIKLILSRLYTRKDYDRELWDELKNLKQQMAEISMVNEFAKYAKLQRKYNKAESILKDNIKQRQNWRLKLQLSLTCTFYVVNRILILLLLYMYNNEIVINLPKDILWPIQDLLSWPSQHKNGISLTTWIIITNIGISSYKNLCDLKTV
ncbi:tail-anchored protein insertion receptor WRB-like [Harpegnathos saltator]|uniref:tail-anchored protein insertion receptor WRB-like n=1 Tax=Harpegnathos saltator TaxID=610380 RepID=UPI000590B787|nr:tail-anchored protein insertion receptor WRB-like [Harpegnathos saltator]